MAFIPTPDVIRFSLRHTLFDQTVVNTMWFRNTVADIDDPANLDLLANALATSWILNMMPELSDAVTFVEVTATSQTSLTAPSVSQSYATPGTIPGVCLPGSVCLAVGFKTAQRGRTGRGRNYLSGIVSGSVADNIVSVGKAQAFLDAYLAINGDMLLVDCEHVVVSHQNFGVPRLQGLAQTVTSYNVSDRFVDSQRRRLNGRGT